MIANMSLWDVYPRFRAWGDLPGRLRSEDLARLLDQLQAVRPQSMTVTELGTSFENRAIRRVTLGEGPTRVLAWSQMHGNEPTHTAVLVLCEGT